MSQEAQRVALIQIQRLDGHLSTIVDVAPILLYFG